MDAFDGLAGLNDGYEYKTTVVITAQGGRVIKFPPNWQSHNGRGVGSGAPKSNLSVFATDEMVISDSSTPTHVHRLFSKK